jgi:hypothetical protein
MLAALAIINMTVAAVLITETADARAEQVPTAVVATVDTKPLDTNYISWADE